MALLEKIYSYIRGVCMFERKEGKKTDEKGGEDTGKSKCMRRCVCLKARQRV